MTLLSSEALEREVETDGGESSVPLEETKARLLQLLRVNEVLMEELKTCQKKLLKIGQDKYFLFERLMAHEDLPKGPGRPPSSSVQKNQANAAPGEVRVKRKYRKRKKNPEEIAASSTANVPGLQTEGPAPEGSSGVGIQFSPGFTKMKAVPGPKRKPGPKKGRIAGGLTDIFDSPASSSCEASFSSVVPRNIMEEEEDDLTIDDED